MSQYLAAILAAPILIRQLRTRAIRHLILAAITAATTAVLLNMGAHHTWQGALATIALCTGGAWLSWDVFDCERIRHNLREKMNA